MAFEVLILEADESKDSVAEIIHRASKVKSLIAILSSSLRKEKHAIQRNTLEEMARDMLDLGDITKFLTSSEVTACFEQAVTDCQRGEASTSQLHNAMTIIAGRLMTR